MEVLLEDVSDLFDGEHGLEFRIATGMADHSVHVTGFFGGVYARHPTQPEKVAGALDPDGLLEQKSRYYTSIIMYQ